VLTKDQVSRLAEAAFKQGIVQKDVTKEAAELYDDSMAKEIQEVIEEEQHGDDGISSILIARIWWFQPPCMLLLAGHGQHAGHGRILPTPLEVLAGMAQLDFCKPRHGTQSLPGHMVVQRRVLLHARCSKVLYWLRSLACRWVC
jgi:hypothetical protein